MDFSSLYLTPHYLVLVNEDFASTAQEKFTHKWLDFEAFQAGMMILSKIDNWKDSSPIMNRVKSTEIRVETSFSVYRLCLFLKRQITFQEAKLSKIDKQHLGKTFEKHYISCNSSFRHKSTILKYIIISSYFEFFVS
jgi:hypothetical protein